MNKYARRGQRLLGGFTERFERFKERLVAQVGSCVGRQVKRHVEGVGWPTRRVNPNAPIPLSVQRRFTDLTTEVVRYSHVQSISGQAFDLRMFAPLTKAEVQDGIVRLPVSYTRSCFACTFSVNAQDIHDYRNWNRCSRPRMHNFREVAQPSRHFSADVLGVTPKRFKTRDKNGFDRH